MKFLRNKLSLGLSLIFIGILMLLINIIHVRHMGILLSAAFLIALAILFARQYMGDDRKWWAIIPAGALFTSATVLILNAFDLLSRTKQWVVFLIGLALTFLYLWTRRTSDSNLNWSIYPATAIGFTAIVVYLGGIHRLDFRTIIALIVIAYGAWLLAKALRS